MPPCGPSEQPLLKRQRQLKAEDGVVSPGSTPDGSRMGTSSPQLAAAPLDDVDAAYFEKYDSAFVHEEMLRDSTRCGAYAEAIALCRPLITGGVVIDVGAGSGILSCLCARAGARRVYAIEASAVAAKLCREVVKANNLGSIVEVVESRVEDLELPQGTQADVIVSEWMGYFLYYESMLDSVITARDKWLRPGGMLLPSRARLYVCPFSDSHWRHCRAAFLQNVCGIDVSPLGARLAAEEASEPAIQGVDPDQLVGNPQCISDIDLAAVALDSVADEQSAACSWRAASREVVSCVHGFAGWFEVFFDPPPWSPQSLLSAVPLAARFRSAVVHENAQEAVADDVASGDSAGAPFASTGSSSLFAPVAAKAIVLSTAPSCPRTCWHQTLFFLPSTARLELGNDVGLHAEIKLKRPPENRRFLCVTIRCHATPAAVEGPSAAGAEKPDQPSITHSWMLRSYAREGTCAAPLPVPRLRGTSRAAAYGGAC